MKKKSTHLSTLITLSNTTHTADTADFPVRQNNNKKPFKRPDPPSEETVQRLNALVKEAPFCFYYQEKGNDFL